MKTEIKLLIGILLLQSAIFTVEAQKCKTITVLHTNDTHSRIESLSPNDKRYPDRGGYAYRSAIIKNIKSQQPNLLLFDAGDFLQGTPYFNFYKGALEVDLMNKLGYRAVTLGNHEFDLGVDHLAFVLKKAKFSIVNCNYDVSKTPLKKIVKPWVIFKIGGVKIGVTGLGVNPDGLISPENFKGIIYHDPYSSLVGVVKLLKVDKKCDYIICLSHLGYQQPEGVASDVEIVKNCDNLDLICGGHTHTLLERADSVIDRNGKVVFVTQSGSMGVSLGRMDVDFSRK